MRCKSRDTNYFLVSALLSFPMALAAHHSTPEDPTSITIEGVLSGVVWANPHIQFQVSTIDQDGRAQEWTLEQPGATSMLRAGIGEELFVIGSPVRVSGPTLRNRTQHMIGWHMLFLETDLEVLLVVNRSPTPIWSDRTIGSGTNDLFSVTGSVPTGRESLFRVWTWRPSGGFWMTNGPDSFPLNNAAREIADDWDIGDPSDNTVLRCIPPGMPATMGDPHPIEFIDLGDVIEIHMEEFDQIRRIHLGGAENPAFVETSPLGYSVGRWEGDTLIVDTSRIDSQYLTRSGVPMSEDVSIEERFSVDAPNGQLRYTLRITDPVYLTESFVHEQIWNWHENTTLQRYDCLVLD